MPEEEEEAEALESFSKFSKQLIRKSNISIGRNTLKDIQLIIVNENCN